MDAIREGYGGSKAGERRGRVKGVRAAGIRRSVMTAGMERDETRCWWTRLDNIRVF